MNGDPMSSVVEVDARYHRVDALKRLQAETAAEVDPSSTKPFKREL